MGNTVLGAHNNKFLLRTLQDRGVKLGQCSFINGDRTSSERCEKYGIYKKDEFPLTFTQKQHKKILGDYCLICYCPEHRDLLQSEDHRGWCTEYVILPNGDTARCQHTGAFSWTHKRYLCKEHLTKVTAEKNEEAALVP